MVGVLRPAAGQSPERDGHCEQNGRDERSDPVGTVDPELAAGWHHERAKFGHEPQGGVHAQG